MVYKSNISDISDSENESLNELFDEIQMEYSQGNIAIFRPTMAQFIEFNELVDYIHTHYEESGIIKILPPSGWAGYNTTYDNIDSIKLQSPIRQNCIGNRGVYRVVPVVDRINRHHSNTIGIFKQYATQQLPNDVLKLLNNNKPSSEQCSLIERKFWRNLTFNPPLYGADTPGQLFDPSLDIWNVAALPSALNAYSATIPGTNTPYLYVGMYKAMFAAHTEDQDLFSINYVHVGAPKQWYSIPPSQSSRFESIARTLFFEDNNTCKDFLRHKHSMIAPHILKQNNIDVNSCVQYAGEFIITFPRAYHFGYNLSFNVAESLNFALPSWIPHGRASTVCKCRGDSVKIHMDTFEQQVYQWIDTLSDRSKQWHINQLNKYNIHKQEWIFNCLCMKYNNTTNLSQWIDQPSGYMFKCPCCSCLSHVYCYRRYQHRQPQLLNCRPYEPDIDDTVQSVMNDMLQSITKLHPLRYYHSLYNESQQPMYCHSCLPTHKFTRLKLCADGITIATATRTYTQWRQRQIAYLQKLSDGGRIRKINLLDNYDDSDDDDTVSVDDNTDAVEQTIEYSAIYDQAANEIKSMIDRDLLNPVMPKPDTNIQLFIQYQRNLFRRLRLLKRKYQHRTASIVPVLVQPPSLSSCSSVPIQPPLITQQPNNTKHTHAHQNPVVTATMPLVATVNQPSTTPTASSQCALPIFALNKSATSSAKRYSFDSKPQLPIKRQVINSPSTQYNNILSITSFHPPSASPTKSSQYITTSYSSVPSQSSINVINTPNTIPVSSPTPPLPRITLNQSQQYVAIQPANNSPHHQHQCNTLYELSHTQLPPSVQYPQYNAQHISHPSPSIQHQFATPT